MYLWLSFLSLATFSSLFAHTTVSVSLSLFLASNDSLLMLAKESYIVVGRLLRFSFFFIDFPSSNLNHFLKASTLLHLYSHLHTHSGIATLTKFRFQIVRNWWKNQTNGCSCPCVISYEVIVASNCIRAYTHVHRYKL